MAIHNKKKTKKFFYILILVKNKTKLNTKPKCVLSYIFFKELFF